MRKDGIQLKKRLVLFFIFSFVQLQCTPAPINPSAGINWGTPVTLSSSKTDNSSDPYVVMDANANATAVWVENGLIMASFLPVGKNWGAAQTLSGSGSSSPKIGVDGSGNVTVIWLNSNSVVNVATLPLNGSWSSSTTISSSGATTPRLAVDSNGNAIAVWVSAGLVKASTRLLFGGTWSLLPSTLSAANSSNPDIAISSNGTAMAVWHTTTVSCQDHILSCSSRVGGTLNTANPIVPASLNHNYPHVALDSNGNATVVWFRFIQSGSKYTNVFVVYSQLPSGAATWSVPVPLSNSGQGNPSNFSSHVGYDSGGNIFAIWTISYDGATYNIESAVRQSGQSFTDLNTLAIGNIYCFQVDAAINSLSDVVIGFMNFDGNNVVVSTVESQVIGPFINSYLPSANLSIGIDNGYPRVASIATGGNVINAAVVWVSSDGTFNTIGAATGSRTLIAAPTNLAVVQSSNNLGLFTEYFNTVSWTESTDPNLVAYALYRNGNYLRQFTPDITEFIDHNAVQNGSVTYGVSAIDRTGSQSAISTVNFP